MEPGILFTPRNARGTTLPASVLRSLAILLFVSPTGLWADGPISASPSSLTFTYTPPGFTPNFQTLTLTGNSVSFTVSTSVPSGDSNWLRVDIASGATPATLSVSVAPSGVSVGSHAGQIILTSPGNVRTIVPVTLNIYAITRISCTPSGGPTTVGVAYNALCTGSGGTGQFDWSIGVGSGPLPAGITLSAAPASKTATLSGTPIAAGPYAFYLCAQDITAQTCLSFGGTIAAAPSAFGTSAGSLAFTATPSGSPPAPATLGVTGSFGAVAFQAAASTSSGGNWLSVSPSQGSTPANLSVSVSHAGLSSGTYSGQIKLTPQQAGLGAVSVPVTLTVLFQVTVSCFPSGGPSAAQVPYSATCNVVGGTAPYSWTVINSLPAGLSFSSSGSTANISGVPTAGSGSTAYSYSVQATDSTGAKGSFSFSGSLAPTLQVTPSNVILNAVTGMGALAPQSVSISSSGPGLVSFSATATTQNGINWLAVSPAQAQTPAQIAISASAAALAPGTYTGQIGFAVQGVASNSSVAVTLRVFAVLSVKCTPVNGPSLINIAFLATCTVTGGNAPYSWSTSGSLPGGLTLNPNGATATIAGTPVSPGPYNYTIAVTDNGNLQRASQTFAGTLSAPSSVTATPANVVFNTVPGGADPVVTVALSTSGDATAFTTVATTTNGGTWLTVSPARGQTPATLSVSAHAAGLDPGTYNGRITITPGNGAGATQLAVTLNVGAPLKLSCAPSTGAIVVGTTYSASCTASGGTAPYKFSVDSGPMPDGVTLSSSGILSGTPTTKGVFNFTIRVTDAALQSVRADLTVTVQGPAPQVTSASLVNAASYVAGLAPGEYFSIFGTNLATVTLSAPSLPLPTSLGKVTVQWNGTALPLLAVSPGQINAQMPFITSASTGELQVTADGVATTISTHVSTVNPGLFQASPGILLAINEDGTLNSSSNPAAAGTTIVFYATGCGPYDQPLAPGSMVPTDRLYRLALPATLTIGDSAAQVSFAGAAPALGSGLVQVNAVIPQTASGELPVILTVSGIASNSPHVYVVNPAK